MKNKDVHYELQQACFIQVSCTMGGHKFCKLKIPVVDVCYMCINVAYVQVYVHAVHMYTCVLHLLLVMILIINFAFN